MTTAKLAQRLSDDYHYAGELKLAYHYACLADNLNHWSTRRKDARVSRTINYYYTNGSTESVAYRQAIRSSIRGDHQALPLSTGMA